MFEIFHYSASQVQEILNSKNTHSPENSLDEINFSSITNSSLEVKKGSLFIPLMAQRDGHDFIPSALENGASGFLCNRENPILTTLTQEQKKYAILVDNTWQALGDLARHHRSRFNPTLVAISGSSGKTTTKELLATCFSHVPSYELVVTQKNFNNEIGVPFTLFRITKKTKYVILEMGMNHRGEIARLSRIAKPNHCILTNIGSAHIENLETPEEIAREKSEIIIGMETKGKLFVPSDISFPEIIRETIQDTPAEIMEWDPSSNPNQLFVKKEYPDGFLLEWKGIEFDWKHPGKKILSNLCGALTCANFLGIDEKLISENIKNYVTPGSRLNLIHGLYTIIDDSYNANPESMESSIQVIQQFSQGKEFACILGEMKELGNYSAFYHKKIGEILNKTNVKYLASFGDIAKEITQAIDNSSIIKEHFQSSLSDDPIQLIVNWILKNIPPQTTILIKGSRSMKMERIIEKILDGQAQDKKTE